MIEGKKLSELLLKSWKKSFDSGINITTTKSFFNKCNKKVNVIDIIFKLTKIKNS